MTKKRNVKKRWWVLGAVSLFLVAAFVPIDARGNHCYPMNDKLGLYGRFYIKHTPLTLFLDIFVDGLDESSSFLYEADLEYLNRHRPDVANLIKDDFLIRINSGVWGIMGILNSEYERPGDSYHWRKTPLEYLGELLPGIYFLSAHNGLEQYYALFSKPVSVDLQVEDWDHFLGECEYTPEGYAAFAKQDARGYAICNMSFWKNDIEVVYRLEQSQVQHYKLMENFIRDTILCDPRV